MAGCSKLGVAVEPPRQADGQCRPADVRAAPGHRQSYPERPGSDVRGSRTDHRRRWIDGCHAGGGCAARRSAHSPAFGWNATKEPRPLETSGSTPLRARFVAFQDSDDEWLPAKLARHMRVFDLCGPEIGVVYSDMERIHLSGTPEYHRSPDVLRGRLINPTTGFYQVCNLGIQSTVIRRECLAAVGGFNEEFPALEDLELFVRLSTRFGFHHLPVPLVRYHETAGISQNMPAKLVARELLLRLYGDAAGAARHGVHRDGIGCARTCPRADPAPMTTHMIEVSICVCTLSTAGRPGSVAATRLRNLDPASPSHSVIVVDNDADATARPVVQKARAQRACPCSTRSSPFAELLARATARSRWQPASTSRSSTTTRRPLPMAPEPLAGGGSQRCRRGSRARGSEVPGRRATAGWIDGGFFERLRFPTGTPLKAELTRMGNALVARRR